MSKRHTQRNVGGAKQPSSLQAARNALRGARTPLLGIEGARELIPPRQYADLLSWISSQPHLARTLWAQAFPTRAAQLVHPRPPSAMALDRELSWALARLRPHAEQLRTFVLLRDRFYDHFMTSSPQSAAGTLDEIESTLGHSLWLVKSRIAVLQATGGLQQQKAYVEQLRQGAPPDGVMPFIAFYISVRNEPTVTPVRLRSQFELQLARMGTPSHLNSWLRYHVTPDIYSTEQDSLDILCHASTGALIDLYLALANRLRVLAAQPAGRLRDIIASVAWKLFDDTADPQLRATLAWCGRGDGNLSLLPDKLLSMLDAQVAGNTRDAANIGTSILGIDSPASVDAFIGLVHLCTRDPVLGRSLSPGSLATRLVELLAGLLRKDASHSDDYAEAAKVAVNLHDSVWAHAILGLLQHDSDEAFVAPMGGHTHIAALALPTLSPQRMGWLPPSSEREAVQAAMVTSYGRRPSVVAALVAIGAEPPSSLSNCIGAEDSNIATALYCLYQRDYTGAIAAAERVASAPYAIYRRHGATIRTLSLLHMGRVAHSLASLVTTALQEPHWQASLPLFAVARVLGEHRSAALVGQLDTPILFDLCSRHLGTAFDRERVFALRDLLRSRSLGRPSELATTVASDDLSRVIYLLRNVSVEAILDRTGLFASSRELLEERLSVCRALTKLDQANQEQYVTEIAGLLRRQTRQKRLREVEQSKIYVDTESIKRVLTLELHESYSRYQALQPAAATNELLADLQVALDELTAGNPQGLSALVLPKSEANDLLVGLARRLLDEYLFSPEHGLDKYLSVRIRHGALATQLRRPFEAQHLMTVREAHGTRYRPNEHWPRHIWGPEDALAQVAGRLGRFSGDYNAFIEEVRSRIAIRKSDKDVGLFDLSLSAPLLAVLATHATRETSFAQYVEVALAHLGNLLDSNLAKVRHYLLDDARIRATELVDELLHDVEAIAKTGDFGNLTNTIRSCRTELQVVFTRLAAWFHRGRDAANEPFPLQDAVDVAADVVRMGCPGLTVDITAPADPAVYVHGHLFSTFFDIFVILFENAVRHSGLEQATQIDVAIVPRGLAVDVVVSNPVAPDVDRAQIQARASRILDEVRAGRQQVAVSREGGTGLHKLGRLLAHDVGVALDLDITVSEEPSFTVRFGLSMRLIDGSEAAELIAAAGLSEPPTGNTLSTVAPELRVSRVSE